MEGRPRRNIRTAMKGVGGGSERAKRHHHLPTDGTLAEVGDQSTATGTSKNALRERTRVESLRRAYLELQAAIPSVPPNTKLSKLDVLVLATTYISHLSQLLQEDDARADRDPNNNNNTTATNTNKSCHLPHSPCVLVHGENATRRTHQKGLLHPVKKWPMRARLYAGVGAPEAATLLTEHMASPRQLYSNATQLPLSPRLSPSQIHPTRQQQHANVKPAHLKTHVEFPTAITGTLASDFNVMGELVDKSYSHPSWLSPQSYSGSYLDTWEADGTWGGADMTYGDLGDCHAPCQLSQPYTTHPTCWQDQVV